MFGALVVSVLALTAFAGCTSPELPITATAVFGSIELTVELVSSHPFLAEYKKFIKVRKSGGRSQKFELFPDTGGYSWVAIYQDSGRIMVDDLGNDDLIIDTTNCNVTKLFQSDSDATPAGSFLGRFDFVSRHPELYRFITSSEQSSFLKHP